MFPKSPPMEVGRTKKHSRQTVPEAPSQDRTRPDPTALSVGRVSPRHRPLLEPEGCAFMRTYLPCLLMLSRT